MNRPRKPKPPPCGCSAYPFPHRPGSGPCACGVSYSYKLTDKVMRAELDDLCDACGRVAVDTKVVDEGLGAYEFWGATGVDVRWMTVSGCCEAHLRPNFFQKVRTDA